MPKVLVINGANHWFDKSAPIIAKALDNRPGFAVTLSDDKSILATPALSEYDALVLGTGFTRREAQPDGSSKWVDELSEAQANGLFSFVRNGRGFVGIHGTGWWIGGEAIRLVGGHANWHPPGLQFSVQIDDTAHPVTRGVSEFTVDDEIYMSAWDPAIHVLASARWADRSHPVAWTHSYGTGRVFYTALGHGPSTFENLAVQHLLANAVNWVSGN